VLDADAVTHVDRRARVTRFASCAPAHMTHSTNVGSGLRPEVVFDFGVAREALPFVTPVTDCREVWRTFRRNCQATRETDPLTTVQLTPPGGWLLGISGRTRSGRRAVGGGGQGGELRARGGRSCRRAQVTARATVHRPAARSPGPPVTDAGRRGAGAGPPVTEAGCRESAAGRRTRVRRSSTGRGAAAPPRPPARGSRGRAPRRRAAARGRRRGARARRRCRG
jgi:hypothetical protein